MHYPRIIHYILCFVLQQAGFDGPELPVVGVPVVEPSPEMLVDPWRGGKDAEPIVSEDPVVVAEDVELAIGRLPAEKVFEFRLFCYGVFIME